MTSFYRQIRGLGILYVLPPEVRERVYDYYFGNKELVCFASGAYRKQYEMHLLLVSPAIYQEAREVEMTPGFEVRIFGNDYHLPPPQFQPLITSLRLQFFGVSRPIELWRYPALKQISHLRAALEEDELLPQPISLQLDDFLKGKLDMSFLQRTRTKWALWHGDGEAFDWQAVPNDVPV